MNMRVRLILAFLLIILVTVASLSIFLRQSTGEQVRNFMVRGGMVGADRLVDRLERYYRLNGSWAGAEEILQSNGMMMHGQGQGMMMSQRLQLLDADGTMLFDSEGEPAGAKYSADKRAQAIALTSQAGKAVGYLLVDGGTVATGLDTQPLVERLQQATVRASVIAGVIALLLSGLLAGQLLRPVRQVTRAAENIAAGKRDLRVPVQGNDELATLAQAFNRMTDSLKESEGRRQAMTAEIAHELRTPLSIQRAQLEAMQDGIYPLNGENLVPLLEQNEVLTRLVEDLRTLALADAGELVLDRAAVDAGQLAARLLERFKPAAEAREITLMSAPQILPDGKMVWADPLRLNQILSNVLNNALQHTPAKGKVTLELVSAADEVIIRIRDSGAGIPPEALPHIFERFYRAGRSRSRDEGGSGLGLAIARQLSEAQGATLEAANLPEGGAVFTLRMKVFSAA